jgi:hypothetical protein
VLVVVLVPIRGKSRTHGWKEKKRSSPHQAHLLPSLTPVHTGSSSRSPFVHTGSPFVSTEIVPINRHGFAIPFHEFWVAIRFHRCRPSVRSSSNWYSRTARAWITPCTSTFVFPPNGIFRFRTPVQCNSNPIRRRWSRPTTHASLSSPAT